MNESAFSLPQIIGYFAFLFGVISFAQKDDTRMKLLNSAQTLVYAIHFTLLGNLPAAGSNLVSVARNLLSLKTRSPYVGATLVAATIVLGIHTVHHPTGLIPVVAVIISIIGTFRFDGVPLRICFLCCTVMWLANNLLSHSYGGIALEFTIGATNFITIVRMRGDARTPSTVS